jgi:hypothetical protein
MKFYRCRTCGLRLVHDGQLEKHKGHHWQNTGSSTLVEDIKIIGWYLWQKAGKLLKSS